jgi:hypothetical protein
VPFVFWQFDLASPMVELMYVIFAGESVLTLPDELVVVFVHSQTLSFLQADKLIKPMHAIIKVNLFFIFGFYCLLSMTGYSQFSFFVLEVNGTISLFLI